MRVIILMVAVGCLAMTVDGAPINGEELISNIQDAAESETRQAKQNADAATSKAEKEEGQLQANREFAQGMSDEINNDALLLDKMKTGIKETVQDAETIETDVKSHNVADIEARDQDAEQKSEEIQTTAEQLDEKVIAAVDKMKEAGISKKKTNLLGESNTGPFQDQLQQTEDDAHQMVDAATAAEQKAESRVQNADEEMASMRTMAHTGLMQLTKAEGKLHLDLNGHRDTELERDIEEKAQDLEMVESDQTQEDPSEQTAYTPEQDADPSQASSEDSIDGMSPNFAPTTLGEKQSPLEAAEQEAEAAAQATDEQEAEAAALNGMPVDSYDATVASPMPVDSYDQHLMVTGDAEADLSAIDQDAKELEAYQANSLEDIKKIREPLQ